MSPEEACLICGQPVDNDDGTGYCSGCAADTGVYAQRAAAGHGEAADADRALTDLAHDVRAILERLEQVEARLAATEERLLLLERARGGEGETALEAPAGEQVLDESAGSVEESAPSLAERARTLGVDYARLRKIYSEDELQTLLG